MPSIDSRDVFVSYAHEDQQWVRETLVVNLQRADLSVLIDYQDFTAGRFSVDLMTEAVIRCRHTVVVLTPAWLNSSWANYEGKAALTHDPGAMRGKLIPLYLQDCECPGWLKPLAYVDFRDRRQHPAAWAKLLRDLGRTTDAIRKEVVSKTSVLLTDLAGLMHLPEVRNAVDTFRTQFEMIQDRLDQVTLYKRLHEAFHKAVSPYTFIYDLRRSSGDAVPWPLLERHALEVCGKVGAILDFARANLPATEVLWAGRLETLSRELLEAVRAQDNAALGRTLVDLEGIFGQEPSKLNYQLVTVAKYLPLQQLRQVLERIEQATAPLLADSQRSATASVRLELKPRDAERLQGFATRLDDVRRLEEILSAMVDNHNCLQMMYDQVRSPYLSGSALSPDAIERLWKYVQPAFRSLRTETEAEWIGALVEAGDDLDQRLAEPGAGLEIESERALRAAFSRFYSETARAFEGADWDLVSFCGTLEKVADSLHEMIRRMGDESR